MDATRTPPPDWDNVKSAAPPADLRRTTFSLLGQMWPFLLFALFFGVAMWALVGAFIWILVRG